MSAWIDGLYEGVEFFAFIVARALQLVLDAFTQLNWVDSRLAMNLYVGLSYASAIVLLFACWHMAKKAIHDGALVIGKETAAPLSACAALVAWAVFTAMAPSTGLSLKYCAKAMAGFIRFD